MMNADGFAGFSRRQQHIGTRGTLPVPGARLISGQRKFRGNGKSGVDPDVRSAPSTKRYLVSHASNISPCGCSPPALVQSQQDGWLRPIRRKGGR
jgi:hypothetical protein